MTTEIIFVKNKKLLGDVIFLTAQCAYCIEKTFVLKAVYRCDSTSSLLKRYPVIQPFIPFKMDAHSGRLKADVYSDNFNNLLGKSYDNYTNKFPQTVPPSHHPYVLFVHIPFTLSSAIITGISACTSK